MALGAVGRPAPACVVRVRIRRGGSQGTSQGLPGDVAAPSGVALFVRTSSCRTRLRELLSQTGARRAPRRAPQLAGPHIGASTGAETVAGTVAEMAAQTGGGECQDGSRDGHQLCIGFGFVDAVRVFSEKSTGHQRGTNGAPTGHQRGTRRGTRRVCSGDRGIPRVRLKHFNIIYKKALGNLWRIISLHGCLVRHYKCGWCPVRCPVGAPLVPRWCPVGAPCFP